MYLGFWFSEKHIHSQHFWLPGFVSLVVNWPRDDQLTEYLQFSLRFFLSFALEEVLELYSREELGQVLLDEVIRCDLQNCCHEQQGLFAKIFLFLLQSVHSSENFLNTDPLNIHCFFIELQLRWIFVEPQKLHSISQRRKKDFFEQLARLRLKHLEISIEQTQYLSSHFKVTRCYVKVPSKINLLHKLLDFVLFELSVIVVQCLLHKLQTCIKV